MNKIIILCIGITLAFPIQAMEKSSNEIQNTKKSAACAACYKSHKKCEGKRPCDSCKNSNQDCVERIPKKKNPRKRKQAEETTNNSTKDSVPIITNNKSCVQCFNSHRKCDKKRPCSYCVKTHKECMDRPFIKSVKKQEKYICNNCTLWQKHNSCNRNSKVEKCSNCLTFEQENNITIDCKRKADQKASIQSCAFCSKNQLKCDGETRCGTCLSQGFTGECVYLGKVVPKTNNNDKFIAPEDITFNEQTGFTFNSNLNTFKEQADTNNTQYIINDDPYNFHIDDGDENAFLNYLPINYHKNENTYYNDFFSSYNNSVTDNNDQNL